MVTAAHGSPLSFYREQSSQHAIYLDHGWLSLIHYQKNLFGGYTSLVHGADFFLSPGGAKSPQAELEATLNRFFSGSAAERKKYQCGFLARRDFLIKELNIPPDEVSQCAEFEAWVGELNPQKISLVFATGTFSNPASSFGHIFLKMRNPKNESGRDLLNYAVNYAAQSGGTTGALYAWYGLLGYFPGNYGMAPYHHLIKEYTNMEGRDLWEYELDFSPQEIRFLFEHLIELEKGYFNYYFIDENCAHMIAVALEVAKPELKISAPYQLWVLPLDVVKSLARQKMILETKFRPSLRTEFLNSYAPLNFTERGQLRAVSRGNLTALPELSNGTLEAAQNFYSLKGALDFRKYSAVNYALSNERAKRPVPPRAGENPRPSAPEMGADSSLITAGYVRRDSRSLMRTGARAVGNDLLDRNVGGAPFGNFELMAIELESADWHETSLHKFKPLDVLSTHPVTWVEEPLSWGLAVLWEKGWQLPLKLGYSVDLGARPLARLMIFATSEGQEVVDGRKAFSAGAEALLLVHFSAKWRGLLDENYDWASGQRRLSYGVAWDLKPSTQLRYERGEDHKLSLNYYF